MCLLGLPSLPFVMKCKASQKQEQSSAFQYVGQGVPRGFL